MLIALVIWLGQRSCLRSCYSDELNLCLGMNLLLHRPQIAASLTIPHLLLLQPTTALLPRPHLVPTTVLQRLFSSKASLLLAVRVQVSLLLAYPSLFEFQWASLDSLNSLLPRKTFHLFLGLSSFHVEEALWSLLLSQYPF